jgi:CTP:molybdopterin cytidylyltransferase MocA
MDIIILAGGHCSPELAAATGVQDRAAIEINGRTCLSIVTEALRPFGDLIIVGGPPVEDATQTPAGKSFIESVRNGLEKATSDRILISTVDIPLLTSASVQDFIRDCDPNAINYPIIRAEDCDRAFPGMKRTTLKLKEGEFTGGNLALVSTDVMRNALPVIERSYEARKSPLKLASIVGIGTLSRLIWGKILPSSLSIPILENSISRFLGVPAHAVISKHPEIGADIDTPEQLLALQALMK